MMATSLDISSLLYLLVFDVFHGALLFGASGQLKYSRGALIPWVPLTMGLYIFSPRTLVHVSGLDWCGLFVFHPWTFSTCVESRLVHEWAFPHPQTGPMGSTLCLDPFLPQVYFVCLSCCSIGTKNFSNNVIEQLKPILNLIFHFGSPIYES